MAKHLCIFTVQQLFGLISLSLHQIISADLRSVDPGENITLLCNITQCSEISWYQMNSAGVRQIISARQGRLDKRFYVAYNVDESHFNVTESNSSVSLVIIGVRETDLGFYCCGGRNDATHTQFGKHIRLNVTGFSNNETCHNAEKPNLLDPAGNGNCCWTTNMIVMSVCSISVVINIICMCAFCSKKQVSYSCCRHTADSTEEEENIHYASVQCKRRSGASAKKNPASDLDSVTYATVTSQPQRQ